MLIRTATTSDRDAITDLHAEGDHLTVFHGQLSTTAVEQLRKAKKDLWTELLARPPLGQRAVVAVDAAEVVAFASAGPDPDLGGKHGRVFALFVARHHWGRGIGSALLATAERYLRETAPQGRLWVVKDNTRAQELYERHGWAPDGASKQSAGADWIRYSKPLSTSVMWTPDDAAGTGCRRQ